MSSLNSAKVWNVENSTTKTRFSETIILSGHGGRKASAVFVWRGLCSTCIWLLQPVAVDRVRSRCCLAFHAPPLGSALFCASTGQLLLCYAATASIHGSVRTFCLFSRRLPVCVFRWVTGAVSLCLEGSSLSKPSAWFRPGGITRLWPSLSWPSASQWQLLKFPGLVHVHTKSQCSEPMFKAWGGSISGSLLILSNRRIKSWASRTNKQHLEKMRLPNTTTSGTSGVDPPLPEAGASFYRAAG